MYANSKIFDNERPDYAKFLVNQIVNSEFRLCDIKYIINNRLLYLLCFVILSIYASLNKNLFIAESIGNKKIFLHRQYSALGKLYSMSVDLLGLP